LLQNVKEINVSNTVLCFGVYTTVYVTLYNVSNFHSFEGVLTKN